MEKIKYGVIYKISNLIDNKYYIGQTTKNPPEKRFKEHKKLARNNGKDYIHNAMRDHGEQNFIFEVVDVAYNQKELNLLEGVYISWFKSMSYQNGYNQTNIIDGKGKPSEETKEKLKIAANKPENLLIRSNNAKKKRGISKPNTTSKYCGVYFNKNRWLSTITINHKRTYLGTFL